ncbi:E3 ubiquitin-protein ligase dtx3l [Paramecium bursaria]
MSKQKIIDKLGYWIQICTNLLDEIQNSQSEGFYDNILSILNKLEPFKDELNFAILPQSMINNSRIKMAEVNRIPNQVPSRIQNQQEQQNASIINFIGQSSLSQNSQQRSQINSNRSSLRQKSELLQVSNQNNYNIRTYLNIKDLQKTFISCKKCGLVNQNENTIQLGCGHEFHESCINTLLKQQLQACPVCNVRLMYAFQMPDGQMEINVIQQPCYGYEEFTTIELQYRFQQGMFLNKIYQAGQFVAYIPDNQEGNDLVDALKQAFVKRATFYIQQDGNNCRLDWLIPHKTQLSGGGANGNIFKELCKNQET